MSAPRVCVLLSRDTVLRRRLGGYLGRHVKVYEVETRRDVESLCERMDPVLVLVDLSTQDGVDAVGELPVRFPESPVVALGVPRSGPLCRLENNGVWAAEDRNIQRAALQALVRRALTHIDVVRENRLLRDRSGGPRPVEPAPAAAERSSLSNSTALAHMSRAFRHFGNVDAALDSMVEAVAAWTLVSRIGVFVRDREGGTFRLRAGIRCFEDTYRMEVDQDDAIVGWMRRNAHLVSRGSLDRVENGEDVVLLREHLDMLGAEVVVPLIGRAHVLGWFFVGRRSTGMPFDEAELMDLARLGEHVALMLENVLLYEEALVQKTLAETMLQAVPLGMVSVDERGIVRWFTSGASALLGVAAGETVGHPVKGIGSKPADLLLRVVNGEAAELEGEWQEPSGKRLLSLLARRLGDERHCLGAVLVIRDLTEERRSREKQQRVEKAQFWAELSAAISHEVKNPLVAIKTLAQLLPERYDDPEFREHFSQLAEHEIDRLNNVVDQICAFANPPAPAFKSLDMESILREAMDETRRRTGGAAAKVDLAAQRNLPRIQGDRVALVDCFAQLLTNAVEVIRNRREKDGSVRIMARATGGVNGQSGVIVQVRDNGGGIPMEISDKVFSPFCTQKARGIGLGLPIVKRTVTEHGGEVTIETGERGTNVVVVLPSDVKHEVEDDETHSGD